MERMNYHFEVKFNRRSETSTATSPVNAFATNLEDARVEALTRFLASHKDAKNVSIKFVRQSN